MIEIIFGTLLVGCLIAIVVNLIMFFKNNKNTINVFNSVDEPRTLQEVIWEITDEIAQIKEDLKKRKSDNE